MGQDVASYCLIAENKEIVWNNKFFVCVGCSPPIIKFFTAHEAALLVLTIFTGLTAPR